MLANLVKKDQLVSASGSTDLLVHGHSMKVGNLILSSILTKANSVFLIAQSPDLPTNMICKAILNSSQVLFTKISLDMSAVACFTNDSKIIILSTVPFLKFVSPNAIEGLVNTPMFSLSALGFDLNSEKSPAGIRESQPFKFTILNAFWWQPVKRKFLVVIETNGVQVISTHTFSIVKSLQYNDVVSGSFAVQENGTAKVALFTKTNTHIITLQQQNDDITHSTTLEGLLYDYSIPLITQMSELKDSKWNLLVLNQKLIFYDNNVKTIPITQFDSSSSRTTSFAVTKNFLFECTDGIASVQFTKSIDVRKLELMRDVISISIVDAENDMVLLLSHSSATLFSLRADPKVLFSEFLQKHQYRDAFALCDGFSLDMKSECEIAATKCIKSGDFDSALEVLREGKCEIRSSLQRLLSEGKEKHALLLLLRSPYTLLKEGADQYLLKEKYEIIFQNLLIKILMKNRCFQQLSLLLRRITDQNSILPALQQFNIFQNNLELLKKGEQIPSYPPALLAKFQMLNAIEITNYLEFASQIDLQDPLPKSFSPEFQALIRIARNNDGCSEIKSLPICSSFRYYNGGIYYLSKGRIFHNGVSIDPTDDRFYMSFEIFGTKIFAIDERFSVYSASIDNTKFEPVDCPNTFMLQVDDKNITFLCVNGSILKLSGGRFFETYDGNYVDMCFFNGVLYGLDEHGVVYSFSDKNKQKVYAERFVDAIASSKHGLLFVSNQTCIYNGKTIQLDFIPELTRSCRDCAVIAGHGKMVVFADSIKNLDYSNRIGTITDIQTDDLGNVVLIGSSSSPMIVQKKSDDSNDVNFADIQLVVSKYPPETTLKVAKGARRTLLLFLYGQHNEIQDKYDEIAPFIFKMDPLNAIAAIHAIASNASHFPDVLLSNPICRSVFIKYPQDLKLLKPEQLVKVLPGKQQSRNTMDLALRLLKPPSSSAMISSTIASESNLVAFSCSHILNQAEFDNSLIQLKDFLESIKLKKSAQMIDQNYKQQSIDLQCPKCLLRQLSQKYK